MSGLNRYIIYALETCLIHSLGVHCFFSCVCAGCIFQQPLSSRGLCFIKCVPALQAEVHSVTVPFALTLSCYLEAEFLGHALVSFSGIRVLTS